MTEQEISKLNFLTKWFLSDEETEQRKQVIENAQSDFIKSGINTKEIIKTSSFRVVIPYLTVLRPITDTMADDFIMGICYYHYPEKREEGLELIKPVLKILEDFYNSVEVKNGLIDKNIHKQDAIIVKGINYNARELVKEYSKGHPVLPLRLLKDDLLLEVKLHKKEVLKQKERKLKGIDTLTGFACPLHPDTVKEIFDLMETSKQISGNLTDFQAIFANTSTPVKSPVKWLIKSQKKPYRGHQTKLYLFIETMLNGKFSAEDKRKAADLFIDEKGKFFNPKMKEPNKNDRDTHNIFETLINNTKEKTRPA